MVWLIVDERRLALFTAGTIVSAPHHRELVPSRFLIFFCFQKIYYPTQLKDVVLFLIWVSQILKKTSSFDKVER